MSRKVDLKTVKYGDRVRVGRESDSNGRALHGIKFGAVCTVVQTEGEDLRVVGPLAPDESDYPWSATQWVSAAVCKVAK